MKNTLKYINTQKDEVNKGYQEYNHAIAVRRREILKIDNNISALQGKIYDIERGINEFKRDQSEKLLAFLCEKALDSLKSHSTDIKRYLDFISDFEGVQWAFSKYTKDTNGEMADIIQHTLWDGETYELTFSIPKEQPVPFFQGLIGIYKNEAALLVKDCLATLELKSINTRTWEGQKLFRETAKIRLIQEALLFRDIERMSPEDCCRNIERINVKYNLENDVHKFTPYKYDFHSKNIAFTYYFSLRDCKTVGLKYLGLPHGEENHIKGLLVNTKGEITSVYFNKTYRGKSKSFYTSVREGADRWEDSFVSILPCAKLPIQHLDDIAGCGFTYSKEFYEDHIKGRRKK